MGSGVERHDALAAPVGRWLASEGVHLLTGGGRGVMEAVSEAFARVPGRHGLVIGVLKGRPAGDGSVTVDAPNPWVEVPIRTHLPLSGAQGTEVRSRNHVNVLTADVVVVLPGGEGTRSETMLALRYARPVFGFVEPGGWPSGWPVVPVATTLAELARLVAPLLARLR